MARNRDLPAWLGAMHPRFAVPHHLREMIGFSSFGVPVYYAITNLSGSTNRRAVIAQS